MRVLVTGRLNSGSWAIRGEQLGAAIGATVQVDGRLSKSELRNFELVVVVKRPRLDTVAALHELRKPFVWDVVDAWPQPEGNEWTREQSLRWLKEQIAVYVKPTAIVATTSAMAEDCKACGFRGAVLTLPHHARPKQALNPIRENVAAVGYQGGLQYLGHWLQALNNQSVLRGWRFIANPVALDQIDIVVALRQQMGYPARRWKSNVKLANAQATGTPCIMTRETGYLETASGAEYWADTDEELAWSLDALRSSEQRARVSVVLRDAAPLLPQVAATYRSWLEALA